MAANNKNTVIAAEEPVELSATLVHLLSSTKYSDLSIHGKNQKWEVHRAVVFSRAPFLEGLGRKEGSKIPKIVIDLSDHQNAVIDALINWIYRGTYSSDPAESGSWKLSEWPTIDYEQSGYDLRFNTSVFVAATSLHLTELQGFAVQKYKDAARDKWDSEAFCDAAEKLWNKVKGTEGVEFKTIMVETARSKVNDLLSCGEFEKLILARPDVAFAILRAVAPQQEVLKDDTRVIVEDIDSSTSHVDEPATPIQEVEKLDGGDEFGTWGFKSSYLSKKDRKKKLSAKKASVIDAPVVEEIEVAF